LANALMSLATWVAITFNGRGLAVLPVPKL
jgi:hypothetical protein